MAKLEKLKFRPYARLLTMLGEQLIKNERIALIELVKNSYDADATWVKVSFENFSSDYSTNQNSRIVIEDNGIGMSADIIKSHWVNPATPEKRFRKQTKPKTKLGRTLQGEKGIGRFAILKLGDTVNLFTRKEGEDVEHHVSYDFSMFDEDFALKGNRDEGSNPTTDLFLDDLSIEFSSSDPDVIRHQTIHLGTRNVKKSAKGTRIEITNLKGSWSEKKIESCYADIAKLQSIFPGDLQADAGFDVYFDFDGSPLSFLEDYKDKLHFLLQEKAVLRIQDGRYDETTQTLSFTLNGEKKSLSLSDPAITGLRVFRQHFSDNLNLEARRTECGSFGFEFYVFDPSTKAPAKFKLDSNDKKIIKPHRIYLYRDGIRVYPYGEQDDDWLTIDQYRGTIAAGDFLSNDQVVGKVEITQDENPKLRDKTNREGLVEEGNASHDLIGILKSFLGYIRAKPYRWYQEDLKDKNAQDIFTMEIVQSEFDFIREALEHKKIGDAKKHLISLQRTYETEKNYLVQRAEQTEDLAGVGLSVEAASHDIMAMLNKALSNLDHLRKQLDHEDINLSRIQDEVLSTRGMLSFVSDQMRDVQLLFRSTKQRRKNIRVVEIVEKVERIYTRIFKSEQIDFEIRKIGSPLVAKTTDAVLLQLLINLFDNSVYWLSGAHRDEKKIVLTLDGNSGKMICSDNGPGVAKEDQPYIFNPFYSGKGEEGRGLGLYIARQLLERHEYTIYYAEIKSERILQGANFVVSFVLED